MCQDGVKMRLIESLENSELRTASTCGGKLIIRQSDDKKNYYDR